MELSWHRYRYYPYEKELALREVATLLQPSAVHEVRSGLDVEGARAGSALDRLVYFSSWRQDDEGQKTLQARLEETNGTGRSRQSTRYSVHGLHEYKGKFNPQIARAIMNIFGIGPGSRVLDPFCGSGTALVECAHLGIEARGVDMNPFAVFLANAKLSALAQPATNLRNELRMVLCRHSDSTAADVQSDTSPRIRYLSRWFEAEVLQTIETLRLAIDAASPIARPVLLATASNLLRDYSLQDPHDLRIRRRKSPTPSLPFFDAYSAAANSFLDKLASAQSVVGKVVHGCHAIERDTRQLALGSGELGADAYQCAVTSPPYATALPYIDTQRLSLVWLGLLNPANILAMDGDLVGSREVRGVKRSELISALENNTEGLPVVQAQLCRHLRDAVAETDGFRRQAVPALLYRYFSDMRSAFTAIRRCVVNGGPFALVVGSNHTVLGGTRFEIDTPVHLAQLAEASGWTLSEITRLQTYRRYGLHARNAVSSEALVVLRAS